MEQHENAYQKKILTIPNVLSFFRLCLIPVILWLYCEKQESLTAAAILILSGVTDVVDGFIARRFHMVSDFGKAFDPVADKLTQAAMLICLCTRYPMALLPLSILVVKEILASVTSILAIRKTGEVLSAVWHGKAATAALYSVITLHFVWAAIPSPLSNLLLFLCTALLILSGVLYSVRNFRMIQTGKVRKPA